MSDFLPLINTIVLALMGGGGVWLWRAERRLRYATAAKVESEADLADIDVAAKIKELSMGLLEPLEAKISKLQSEVKELREKLDGYIAREAKYEEELAARDTRIEELRAKLFAARDERTALSEEVAHLKERLHNAGINGE